MAGNVRDLTDADFAEGVKNGVTLVDFWAPWCPPCRAQGPIVEQLAGSFSGMANIAKVNVDENGTVAGKYSIMNIPTILIFKNGVEIKRLDGLQQEASLTVAINEALQ